MLNRLLILLIGIAFVSCGDSRINIDTLPKQEIEWVELDTDVKGKLIEGEEQIYLLDIPMVKSSFTNTSIIGLWKGVMEVGVGKVCFWYEYDSKPMPPFVFKNGNMYYLSNSKKNGYPAFRNEKTLGEFEVMKTDVSGYLK